MLTLKLHGKVSEAETGVGIPGLFVKAYDKDLIYDDLMGSAHTRDDGSFDIAAEPEDFRDFFEVRPDIYLKVFAPDGTLISTTETAVRWNAGPRETFDVRIARDVLGDFAPRRGIRMLDESGTERQTYDVGESLILRITGLSPGKPHDLVLLDEQGNALIPARVMSSRYGEIEPFVLWPQAGLNDPLSKEVLTVEEAERRWRGRQLRVVLRAGDALLAESPVRFPEVFERPLLLGTDAEGVPVNGFEVGTRDAVVSAWRVPVRGTVRVFMVPRQHGWTEGDAIRPARLRSGRLATVDVDVDADGRFRARIARARELLPGAYQFVVRPLRYGYRDHDDLTLRHTDLLVGRQIGGLVIREEFMRAKTVRGGCVNTQPISGRAILGAPYFTYADTFQIGEPVYGALDPNALAPTLISKMVALYVIPHKSPSQWSADGSLNHLPTLGGNAAVPRFLTQSSCINANKVLLWPSANASGEYDIVADFGNNSGSATTFTPDNYFDPPLDMVDGYFLAGFRVVPDPATYAQFAHAGTFEYLDASATVVDDFGSSVTVQRRAVVYFPADAAGATTPAQISAARPKYPVVIVAHGNSSAQNSYQGYNYLLEHLAKNGFIAASIHMNPGMHGTGRARMIREHLQQISTRFGTTSANNIGLMGHSRGGEAVAIAVRLNKQEGWGYNINAAISLAPTDQYTNESVGGTWATPYFVIYGSMDGDVAGGTTSGSAMNTGFALYDRASGAEKAMLFAYGAIHGHFNTVWGDGDLYFGQIGASDYPKLISADAHQKIAKGYMTAFFRRHQQGAAELAGIFQGEWTPAAVEQADGGSLRLFMQYEQYQAASKRVVDDFQDTHTATSWQTSTPLGAAVADDNTLPLDPNENVLYNMDAQSPHDTSGLLLKWDGTGDRLRYTLPAGQRNVSAYPHVSFRVTQRVGSASNPAGLPQNLYVTLKDTNGVVRSVQVSKFAEIPEPHARHYAQFTKSAMCTARIPLHVFTIKVLGLPPVDLANIETLTFEFNAVTTGEIEIDTVEFTA